MPPVVVADATNATLAPNATSFVLLEAENSTCYAEPCTYEWTLECPGAPNKTFNGTVFNATVGPGSSFDIDTSLIEGTAK